MSTEKWADISDSDYSFKIRDKNYLDTRNKYISQQPHYFKFYKSFCFKKNDKLNYHKQKKCIINEIKKFNPNYTIIISMIFSKYISFFTFINTNSEFNNKHFHNFIKSEKNILSNFKMIPNIKPKNLISKFFSRPVIVCKKLRSQVSIKTKNLEVIIDINSSKIARTLLKTCLSIIKQIEIDIAWVIQGNSTNELPEFILGAINITNVNLDYI
jgi:hypothetical protein